MLNSFHCLRGRELVGSDWKLLRDKPSPWTIDGDQLVLKGSEFKNDLVSKDTFENFVLEFEFALTPGANSGIKYLIQDTYGNIGLEYQIVDDSCHLDALASSKRQTAALYDLFAPGPKLLLQSWKFNHGKIVFQDGFGEHWLNGDKVLEYDLNSMEFETTKSQSKFKTFPWFGTFRTGKILIQDHGDPLIFRHLEIR